MRSASEPPPAGRWRLAWAALAVAFIGGAVYSSLLVLRDAPVGPQGHGAELRAFLPVVHGQPVLYAGQDRYAAYWLLGADTHVPLVEFPNAEVLQNPEKPSTPATPTARSTSTPSPKARSTTPST